jgi:hypothetical protein
VSPLLSEAVAAQIELERLLDELPAVSPDHQTVALTLAEVRAVVERLQGRALGAGDVVSEIRATTYAARALVRALRERHAKDLQNTDL